MRKVFYFLLGVVIGGLTGGIVALLFTPQSGGDMRGQIKDYTMKTMDDIRMAASEKRIQLEKQLTDLRKPSSEKPV
jgi:gas vesicle protein